MPSETAHADKFSEGNWIAIASRPAHMETEIWARINGLHELVRRISNWANFITRRRSGGREKDPAVSRAPHLT